MSQTDYLHFSESTAKAGNGNFSLAYGRWIGTTFWGHFDIGGATLDVNFLYVSQPSDYILKTGKESAIVDVTNLVGFFNNRVGDTQARIERSNHNHDVNLMNSNMRAGHVNREVTPMIKVRRAHHDIVEYLDEKLGFLQF